MYAANSVTMAALQGIWHPFWIMTEIRQMTNGWACLSETSAALEGARPAPHNPANDPQQESCRTGLIPAQHLWSLSPVIVSVWLFTSIAWPFVTISFIFVCPNIPVQVGSNCGVDWFTERNAEYFLIMLYYNTLLIIVWLYFITIAEDNNKPDFLYHQFWK